MASLPWRVLLKVQMYEQKILTSKRNRTVLKDSLWMQSYSKGSLFRENGIQKCQHLYSPWECAFFWQQHQEAESTLKNKHTPLCLFVCRKSNWRFYGSPEAYNRFSLKSKIFHKLDMGNCLTPHSTYQKVKLHFREQVIWPTLRWIFFQCIRSNLKEWFLCYDFDQF